MIFKQELLTILKRNIKKITIGVLLIGTTIFLDVIQPIITKRIVDNGVLAGNISIIFTTSFILFVILILKLISDYWGNRVMLKVTIDSFKSINEILIKSLFNKNRNFYSENPNGEILEKTLEIWNLEDTISASTIHSLISITSLFITIAILLYYSVSVTIFVIITSIALMTLMKFQSKKLMKFNKEYYQYSGEVTANLSESIYGMDEILNLDTKSFFTKRFLDKVNKKLDSFNSLSRVRFLTTSLVSGITSLMYLFILIFVGYNIVTNNNMTLGTYMLILTYSSRILTPIMQIGSIITELQPLKVIYSRIQNIIEDSNISYHETEKQHNIQDVFELKIENLSFSYDTKSKLLKNISMDFKKGSITLIKGANGVGKSTLFKLILQNYTNYTGVISLNNMNINNVNLSSIIAQTLQNPYIFNMSIKENILLDRDYSSERYKKMIDTLKLDKVFSKDELFNNYSIEENGKSLSGGQVKLIELARIYYQDSKVILLDEITANLDSTMCNVIQNAVQRISKDKIIIIVDHNRDFESIITNTYIM